MLADSTIVNSIRVGDWIVDPVSGDMARGDERIRLEDRTLRLLLCLVDHAGEVLSIDDLLSQVWQGVIVSPDSIYQAITSLRRQLGDNPKNPSYIATVPRRGYRLIATVTRIDASEENAKAEYGLDEQTISQRTPISGSAMSTPPDARSDLSHASSVKRRPSQMWRAAALAVFLVSLATVMMLARHATANVPAAVPATVASARSVAVLPFLDLTDEMNEEPFADGMAEELIDRLSKMPGVSVSPPASSNFFKDKKVTVPDVARSLHVAFVLDGSVRKSGTTIRVAARLTRAVDGFVVWSETYDRSWSDKLMIQDDIATEVTKALAASIH